MAWYVIRGYPFTACAKQSRQASPAGEISPERSLISMRHAFWTVPSTMAFSPHQKHLHNSPRILMVLFSILEETSFNNVLPFPPEDRLRAAPGTDCLSRLRLRLGEPCRRRSCGEEGGGGTPSRTLPAGLGRADEASARSWPGAPGGSTSSPFAGFCPGGAGKLAATLLKSGSAISARQRALTGGAASSALSSPELSSSSPRSFQSS